MEVIDTTIQHIKMLSILMRKADKEELWATDMLMPEEALYESFEKSSIAKTMFIDDKIIGIFGVVPLQEGFGIAWFLSSTNLYKYGKTFAKVCKENRASLWGIKKGYKVLVNMVDARYKTSLNWLKWLGFNIHEAEPFGPFGLPFHKISMEV